MSKADQRKRRVRKRGKRTPSGQLSRAKAAVQERQQEERREAFEEGPTQTVLRARNRQAKPFHQPDTPEGCEKWRRKALKPVSRAEVAEKKLGDCGSVLGRLRVKGVITEQEQQAGEDFCARYLAYATLNGLPRLTAKIASYGSVGGRSGAMDIEAAIRAKAAHMADERLLNHCSAGVRWAIFRACVEEKPATPHLVKEGLRALAER